MSNGSEEFRMFSAEALDALGIDPNKAMREVADSIPLTPLCLFLVDLDHFHTHNELPPKAMEEHARTCGACKMVIRAALEKGIYGEQFNKYLRRLLGK